MPTMSPEEERRAKGIESEQAQREAKKRETSEKNYKQVLKLSDNAVVQLRKLNNHVEKARDHLDETISDVQSITQSIKTKEARIPTIVEQGDRDLKEHLERARKANLKGVEYFDWEGHKVRLDSRKAEEIVRARPLTSDEETQLSNLADDLTKLSNRLAGYDHGLVRHSVLLTSFIRVLENTLKKLEHGMSSVSHVNISDLRREYKNMSRAVGKANALSRKIKSARAEASRGRKAVDRAIKFIDKVKSPADLEDVLKVVAAALVLAGGAAALSGAAAPAGGILAVLGLTVYGLVKLKDTWDKVFGGD